MTKSSPCLPALLALSASLRAARTAERLGLRKLADKVGVSAQALSLWETGKRAPALEDVAHILGFLRVSPREYDRVMRLRRQLDHPIFIEPLDAGSASPRRALEELAVRTFEWAPHVVPEPLQTPEYIHALLQRHAAPDDIDQAIFGHHVRQLDQGGTGPRTVLLGATALEPAIDSQLQALRTAAGLPGMKVKIVPPSISHMIDPFTIYETGSKVFTVALQRQENIIFVSEHEMVQRYQSTFKALERQSVTFNEYQPNKSIETF